MRLPTFLVIGAAKAGTTSLHRYLDQHPQIFMSPVKEPRFFAAAGGEMQFNGPDDERLREATVTTLDGYRSLFAGVRGERALGESSTIYLESEAALDAISRTVPEVRLVAVLRDPAERAYSAFLHLRRDRLEPEGDFDKALDYESRRVAAGWYHYWRYRERGFYHRHLQRYVARFGRERIRVYLHEDLDRTPLAVLADLFGFLGVDPDMRPDVRVRHHVSGLPRGARVQRWLHGRHPVKEALKRVVPEAWGHAVIHRLQPRHRPRPAMPAAARARLVADYRDDIRQLERLIGRDLSAWMR